MTLSIVVPVLNEGATIAATLAALQPLRAQGVEVIVVDGGSIDATVALCQGQACHVIHAPCGRAKQMNAGAAQARSNVLLFLHADTLLPIDAMANVHDAMGGGATWGRFDVQIEGQSRLLPVVAALMNRRSRWTGIATGDQAMFVGWDMFQHVGGFPDQPLMEDVELSRRLRRLSKPACLTQKVRTSGRRWDQRGAWRTVLLMWRLRWRYWRGAPADELVRAYR